MGRRPGRRNADFAHSRDALVEAVRERLVESDGAAVSFRQLAAAAGVSVPTLRHYFGDREGVVRAVMERYHRDGLVHLHRVAAEPLGPLAESVRAVLDDTVAGFAYGLGTVHVVGLGAGMGHATLGHTYLAELLEPTLQAIETRLARHVAAGDLRQVDVRHAALSLFAPVFLLLLHQYELGGATYRPADLARFLTDHVAGFVAAYGADTASVPAGADGVQARQPAPPADARARASRPPRGERNTG